MNNAKIRAAGVAALVALWAVLAGFSWFGPKTEISEAERRPLAQMPEISGQTILSGKFMSEFEDYALDQFPLRDTFRQVKSLFHYNVLGQKDNNGIILHDSYAAKMEYPLRESSVKHALKKFDFLYEQYLKNTGSKIYMAIAPDKGMYLQMSDYLNMDYTTLYKMVESGMPYAQFINLADQLSLEDYYHTDTHWRQERLLAAAGSLCESMGISAPKAEEFTAVALERPFYGVYYGQAALPMDPETMYVMESDWLSECRVTNFETGKTGDVYDMEKLTSRDLYDVFLSGAVSLLEIENPHGQSGKELIVFRDSFGSSMIPLIMKDYEKVTIIDIRYIASEFLGQYVDFHGQDVLFLYSTLILNSSSVLK